MRIEALRWRLAGIGLFALACGLSYAQTMLVERNAAIETGLSLLAFLLASAGALLMVSGRHWIDRGAGDTSSHWRMPREN